MASGAAPPLYPFDHDHGRPARELVDLLGGKGAGLAEMTCELGLAVPPGFTVPLPVCRAYRADGWPPGLDDAIAEHVDRLGAALGRRLGDPADPLLLAVRSGAPISMPGMLDTILNLGLNDETVLGLAARSGDEAFAWDSYRRFLLMYATTVLGLPAGQLGAAERAGTVCSLREQVRRLADRITELAGSPVPTDPAEQLRAAVRAVFDSWDSDRARAYRAKEGIAADMGTAVTVQAMVFGNRGAQSGTGVVFTRDPSTGEAVPFGDYLPQAQGEDVVAGTAHTLPIGELRRLQPAVDKTLREVLRRLEIHYRDVCDVEFTVEQGRLWLLQTRVGKRGAVAACRIAVDLVDDPDVALTPTEALARVPVGLRERARADLLASSSCSDDTDLLGTGVGASPGRATGMLVLSSEAAADAEGDVILVRAETSPADIAGMAASVGILTTRGGLVSHAAVVARGWGIPAVVGATELSIVEDGVRTRSGLVLRAGDEITIDGATGQVWAGRPDSTAVAADGPVAADLARLDRLESWAAAAG